MNIFPRIRCFRPSWGDGEKKIIAAVKSGKLPESLLDGTVERMLKIVFAAQDGRRDGAACDLAAHHALARRAAGECAVLLKNDGVLPLREGGTIAVIGAFAGMPRHEGGGSSHINSSQVDIPLEEIRKAAGGGAVTFSEGYRLDDEGEAQGSGFGTACESPDEELIREAVEAAAVADTAVIFAGLPDLFESEGYDRRHIRMPRSHTVMIEAVTKARKNTVVVLMNGSPVEMP